MNIIKTSKYIRKENIKLSSVEGKRKFLEQNNFPKDIVNWAENISNQIEPNGNYMVWLSRLAQKNIVRPQEDDSKLLTKLQLFNKLKKINKIDRTDINSFKTYGELAQYLEPFQSVDTRTKGEKVEEGAELVSQQGNVEIYKITTPELAKKWYLPPKTEWCIANEEQFNMYDPPVYFAFHVNGKPYALLHENSGQFKNKFDGAMTRDELVPIFKQVVELVKKNNVALNKELGVIYKTALAESTLPGIKESLYENMHEGYKNYILKDSYGYKNLPEEFKTEEIKKIAYENYKNYILGDPYSYRNLPEEFKTEEIKKIAYENYKNIILKNAFYYQSLPEEFKTEEFKKIAHEGYKNHILSNIHNYQYLPEEAKTEEIKKIAYEEYKNYIFENPSSYKNLSEEFKTEEMKKVVYEGHKDRMFKNPDYYKYLPEEFKTEEMEKNVYEGYKNYIFKHPNMYKYLSEKFKTEEMKKILQQSVQQQQQLNPQASIKSWYKRAQQNINNILKI